MNTAVASNTTSDRDVESAWHRHAYAKRARGIVLTILGLLFAMVYVFPFYWMVNSALKPRGEIMTSTPLFWPKHFTWENFVVAVTQTNFLLNLKNSLIVVVTAVVFSLIVAFFACYALTRFRFRGRTAIMVSVLIVQMLPGTAMLIPQFLVFNQLGLLNTYAGLILAYISGVLPFSIWNLRNFFLNIPIDIEEAAMLDGASTWKILWYISLPLLMPGLVSTSVFAFISGWNDYLTAYTFMKDQSMYTLPVWLASFSTPRGVDYGAQMAAATLFSLPVVIVFVILQRHVTDGAVMGAVK